MIYHVLNGDALLDRFKATGIDGKIVVMRECLVEGDVSGDTLSDFFGRRARYITSTHGGTKEDYDQNVVTEIDKLLAAPNHSSFHLWFGYDLFCQTNMWFLLSLMSELPIDKNISIVYPSYLREEDIWNVFGGANKDDLITAFDNRVPVTDADLVLGKKLWQAYSSQDLIELAQLSRISSPCYPYLRTVCLAHIDRFPNQGKGRPERIIEGLIEDGNKHFAKLYPKFSKQAGEYGFGDTQVKTIYDKVIRELA